MLEILVIDDDLRMRQLIAETLSGEGYSVVTVGDSRDGLLMLKEKVYPLIITDLKMPYIDGLDVLDFAKKTDPDAVVIMITAHGTVESAIQAMKKGAYDYIQKPFDPEQMSLLVARAAEYYRLKNENIRLSTEVELFRDEFIGASRDVASIKDTVEKAAPLDTTVLIQGETGTGKELVAKMIHKKSSRAHNIFLPVNCAAIAESILESELFGYEKGAFTGATGDKKGLFESANGGTIFLDEINNTSPAMQVKLLRVLQERTIMRVGSTKPINVDIRIIAASNTNLADEVAEGRFRKDLYYRLNIVTLDISPLRDRRDDIQLLAYHFLNKFCLKFNKGIKSFSPDATELLFGYSWPGNVRELENIIERAVIMEASPEITQRSLPGSLKKEPLDPFSYMGNMTLDEMEKFLIQRTLRSLDGHKSRAAEALGIDITTLWRKLKKYNLSN